MSRKKNPDFIFGLVAFAIGGLILSAGLAIGDGLGLFGALFGGVFMVVGLFGVMGESPER